jgi:tetratricopeptide (TPR) repeat protein
MPTISSSQLPPPKSWDEFEEICADLFTLEWRDRNVVRHGRQGQRQHGVDIYGRLADGGHAGVQCKGKRRWPPTELTTGEIDAEVQKALNFRPTLNEYTIVSTALDDAALQEHARTVTERHRDAGLFSVHILGWGEITRRLATHTSLVEKHYGFSSISSLREAVKVIGARIEEIPERTAAYLSGHAAFSPEWSDALVEEFDRELNEFKSLADQGRPLTAIDLAERFKSTVWQRASGRIKYRISTVLAYCYECLGERERAGHILREAVVHDPTSRQARINAAYADLLLGDKDAAKIKAKGIIDAGEATPMISAVLVAATDPHTHPHPSTLIPSEFLAHPDVQFALGLYYRRAGDLESARASFESSVAGSPRHEPRIALAEHLIEVAVSTAGFIDAGQFSERQYC